MAFSSWVCSSNPRTMHVKIVHPGGHIELHNRPVHAAEILLRNPRCCVTLPNVFQQPWAVVAPDTTLMPGQKFYLVPTGTIRKLQKLSVRYSPSMIRDIRTSLSGKSEGEDDGGLVSTCCFISLLTGVEIKTSRDDLSKEQRSSSYFGSSETR
ncbi:unnamed protein product [Ilex paraguariensis]|uniref:Uncharacterized protein n=1 Tax=Ilex paraguariensis TaxID=185542 RepID=A0ABC8TJW8_9AQUA